MVRDEDIYVVLSDGETYTNLVGCKLIILPKEFELDAVEFDDIIEGLASGEMKIEGARVLDLANVITGL